MKKLLLFFALSTLSLTVSAQDGSYVSYTSDKYVSIDIRTEGTTIYYKLKEIAANPEIGSGFYNLSDIVIAENGNFEIPDNGKNYWLIPFDGTNPVTMAQCTTGTRKCGCEGGDGACNDAAPFCRNTSGCHECMNSCGAAGASARVMVTGGSILVYATAIKREE